MFFLLFKIIKDFYFKFSKSGVEYARSKGVNIGDNCRIYISNFGSEPWLIFIGNKVTITSGVKLLTHDGSTWLMNDIRGRRYLFRKIVIGDNVFIGVNSIIMPGVKIENDVIIAAGSVVTKSVPKGSIVAGNPAAIIGNYYNYELKVLSEYIADNDMDFCVSYRERIEKVVDNNFKKYIS
jgi:acetyltransferase-like isoleucine patch superfamily enzyme